MRFSKHQQWLDHFLYPFEMLQQYYFKIYFMVMVTELVVKLLDSEFLLVIKLSPVQCFILWCHEKNENLNKSALFKCVGHCIMRFVIPWGCCVEKGLWAVTVAGYLKTDSLQQLLSFYSVLLACQKCSTRALAVCLTHLFCISFCFFLYHRAAKKA